MKRRGFLTTVFTLSILALAGQSPAQEAKADGSTLDKNKKEIVEDLGVLEQGLYKTRECVYGAQTEEQLQRCRDYLRTLQFQKVQKELNEMGMTKEERRMERFPQEK